ncbi:MAG: hypothetical protein N2320_02320 [Candidatus Bipolaricaulota bacterium]|nr:hypothetical protein [Candidatus Bipolaricaulota bacterium]
MSAEERKEERTDVEELREVLDVVAEKVPGLLRELRNVLYSKEAAEGMADAVGTFYKKLVEAGIPKEEALEMARGYMINLREVLQGLKADKDLQLKVRTAEKGDGEEEDS